MSTWALVLADIKLIEPSQRIKKVHECMSMVYDLKFFLHVPNSGIFVQ